MSDRPLSNSRFFREAFFDDIPTIIDIHNANVLQGDFDPTAQNHRAQGNSAVQGFMLAPVTEPDLSQKIGTGHRFFLALIRSSPEGLTVDTDLAHEEPPHECEQDIPAGYISISTPTLTPDMLQSISWSNDFDPALLMSDRHIYIQSVAVYRQWAGQGIGRFLYQCIYEAFPTSCLSLFVATKPLCNERSLEFHHRQGFSPVGTWRKPQFLGLKDYESLIFFREAHTE
ncbi:MAG: GNAT family N-acetyltransferase [Elainellaceae cyanobacterium]